MAQASSEFMALLATIKECANLEKIRQNMVKEGQEVSYDRWAKAAGVDEAILKSTLQAGYCCRGQREAVGYH